MALPMPPMLPIRLVIQRVSSWPMKKNTTMGSTQEIIKLSSGLAWVGISEVNSISGSLVRSCSSRRWPSSGQMPVLNTPL